MSAGSYATLAEFKAALGITDTTDDLSLSALLGAVSREIDAYCARRFDKETDTRYFTADNGRICFTDDIVSVTTITTDDTWDRTYSTTWAATDFDLEPANALSRGEPFTWLELTPNSTKSFPTVSRGVKAVCVFGWPTIPSQANEACLIQAARLHMRPHAPFGIVGNADMGQLEVIPKLDPDVALLLSGLRKPGAYGI